MGDGTVVPVDDLGDQVVPAAVAAVDGWVAAGALAPRRRSERAAGRQLHRLTGDPAAMAFAMAFVDRVTRPEAAPAAAAQLRAVAGHEGTAFLSRLDRLALRVGSAVSRSAPHLVMPLARWRIRRLVGELVVDRRPRPLARQFGRLAAEGFRVNANLLGEMVLGESEARRRREAVVELLARPDVRYVSVKASGIASQLDLWGYDHSLGRVKASLRDVLRAAGGRRPAKFVNVDMEEYKDLELTLDAFRQVLDEPEFRRLDAGVVLQAYLPDSFEALRDVVGWAQRRRGNGGAQIKVRVVKGANLAMERVDAALHGWPAAPYATKAETDASYKRLLDWAFQPERIEAARIGVATHNLFEVAWARQLAERRGVTDGVEFEMLQGMAPEVARTVRDAVGGLLLYTPIVDPADFDTALAYLFRRLDENAGGENFLRHLFDLSSNRTAFAAERHRFEAAVGERWTVATTPRRRHPPPLLAEGGFVNTPDADPTDPAARAEIVGALRAGTRVRLPDETGEREIGRTLETAVAGGAAWRALPVSRRAELLRQAGAEIAARRASLISVMAHEAGKTIAEGNVEVSEAADYARYYAERAGELEEVDGAAFDPLGVVAVVPPWNFPMAIPIGGALAALAAGNAAILKPAPETPACARAVVEACWAAGIPTDALQYVRCPDTVAEQLVTAPEIDGIVLTGSFETAQRIRAVAPRTPLFAETSGKNSIVVMPDADIDLAVADVVHSAFGHAGQKCSAASLVVCVGAVARSARFRRQLADATRSLIVAPATRPEAAMGALIGPPTPKLRRALEEAGPWLVEPRLVDGARNLWAPGILDGVAPGSWFHRTECFGPVLGLMAAADLDEALAFQNGTPFGLTGGLESLDPTAQAYWLERVEVGNAYVNRPITGAIVGRQPFGGWKRSVVGPAAKTGGVNYVAQLGRWRTVGDPALAAEPGPGAQSVLPLVGGAARPALMAALRSDAYWWDRHFRRDHDPSAVFCEANRFRYRGLPSLEFRVGAGAAAGEVARVLGALAAVGSDAPVSVDPSFGVPDGVPARVETAGAFEARLAAGPPERIRLVGDEPLTRLRGSAATFVDDRPPVANGRIELARYLREQAVSQTLHRFGNLTAG